jgi:hypothetical protein
MKGRDAGCQDVRMQEKYPAKQAFFGYSKKNFQKINFGS